MADTDNSTPTIDGITNLLVSCISTQWTRKRLPYGFRQALTKARDSFEESTPSIFLSKGLKVWFAYHLAANPRSSNFVGRTAQIKLIEALHGLPLKEQEAIANTVAASEIHSSVALPLKQMEMAEQGQDTLPTTSFKRRRKWSRACLLRDAKTY